MFEYLFPIFCFGVVVMAIVVKGLFMAAEFAKSETGSPNRKDFQSPESLFATRSYPFPSGEKAQSEQPPLSRKYQ